MNPSEAEIQRAIIDYLKHKKYYVIRMHSGLLPMVSQTGRYYRLRVNRVGTPDLLAIKDGGCLFIEVKRLGGKPTLAQIECMKELEAYGAKCLVIHSVEELEKML